MRERYVFHITKICNCNCLYCYEKNKTTTYGLDELINYANSIISSHNLKNTEFEIEFIGGEPMLEWEKIDVLHRYIEARTRDTNGNSNLKAAIITTNGTIIPEGFVESMKKFPYLKIGISLDGHKFANQLRTFTSNTMNTYDTVVKNCDLLIAGGIMPVIHITAHNYNVAHIKDSIKILWEKHGLTQFHTGIVETTMKLSEKFPEYYINEMKKLSDWVKEMEKNGHIINVHDFKYLKPKNDIRTYISNQDGVIIGESYGRTDGDLYDYKTSETLPTKKCNGKSEMRELIHYMKETVYNYHNNIETTS